MVELEVAEYDSLQLDGLDEGALPVMFEEAVRILRDQLDQAVKGALVCDRQAQEIRNGKAAVISRFGAVFASTHIPVLSEEEFKDFLLFRNNKHWDSIHRQGPLMTSDMNALRRALALLVDENRPLRERLDRIRPSNSDPIVKGLGRAVITAILHVTKPEKYGVLNSTAEGGMQKLKVWPSFPAKSSFGERYERVNAVLLEIADQVPTDLWTLDMLWWRVLQPEVPVATVIVNPSVDSDNLEIETRNNDNAVCPAIGGGGFALESHLQEFLVENWAQTIFGSQWNLLEKDGEIVGSYYETREVGQIDLLAHHKAEGRWLVIELKKGQTSDATVGQLLRYCSWVRENLATAGEVVEGAIICSDADLKLKYAIKGLPNVRCMTYKVNFILEQAELSTAKAQAV